MNFKISKVNFILWTKKILICTLSLFFLGLAGSLNIKAALGADPITVFYEGLSKSLNMDIGITINILNVILTIAVLFIERKYINIGTLIYVLTLGYFVNFGIWLYELFPIPNSFIVRLLVSLFGCLLAFIGLGGFMAINIGVDPWTAITLIACEKLKKSFRLIRTILDASTLILGIILGGTFGIITVFCVLVGGFSIQKIYDVIDKMIKKMLKSNCED